MKGVHKEWWFWVIVLLIIIIVYAIIISNTKVDGSRGGILDGPSHKNGGIKTVIRSNGEEVELEGNEAIINKNSMQMNEKIICEGTPAGIASAINVIGGGVKFDENGKCTIK